MRLATISIAFALFAAPVNAWSLSDLFSSYEDRFLEACQTVLKQRLKSPTSFSLLSDPIVQKRPATIEDDMGWTDNPEKRKADKENISQDPEIKEVFERKVKRFNSNQHILVRAILEYEAANSYGALIRNYATCTHTDLSPDKFSELDALFVMINGYTTNDWILAQLRQ